MLLWADGWEREAAVGKQKREHLWPDTTLLHSCSYSPFLRPSLITTNTPRLKYRVTRDNLYSLHLLSCYLGFPLLFVISSTNETANIMTVFKQVSERLCSTKKVVLSKNALHWLSQKLICRTAQRATEPKCL